MKMRTLGRHHKLLQLLYDGEFKRRCELKDGLGSMDAHTLQDLLERGLADRLPRDTSERGWYVITAAGKRVFETLESVDPFPEIIPREMKEYIHKIPAWQQEEGMWNGASETTYTALDSKVAWSKYHWVEVECPMDEYWIDYFKSKVW